MVTLYFSHQSLVGGNTIRMGIKKAQAPSHILRQARDGPKSAMVESALWCAAPMLIWFCS